LTALLGAAAPGTASETTRTLTLLYGPILVGPNQTAKTSDQVDTPPVSGSIVAMDAQLVDAAVVVHAERNARR
jgi:hypothetical protein